MVGRFCPSVVGAIHELALQWPLNLTPFIGTLVLLVYPRTFYVVSVTVVGAIDELPLQNAVQPELALLEVVRFTIVA